MTDPAETEAGTWHVVPSDQEGWAFLDIGDGLELTHGPMRTPLARQLVADHALAAKVSALEAALEEIAAGNVAPLALAGQEMGEPLPCGCVWFNDCGAEYCPAHGPAGIARAALDDLYSAEVGR